MPKIQELFSANNIGLSSNKIDKNKPLVSAQINNFQDGVIIGFTNDHSVMDRAARPTQPTEATGSR